MRKANITLTVSAVILAFTSVGKAQTLETYYNFTSYGTVSSGSQITDATGTTTATVNGTDTSLTSGGLATTAFGGSVTATGVTLNSGSLNVFGTGAFAVQDWLNPYNGTPGNNVVGGTSWTGAWGGSSGTAPASSQFLFGSLWGTPVGNGTSGGLAVSQNSMTTSTLTDYVLTYDGAGNFKTYENGVLSGSLSDAYFNTSGGLAGVVNFAINGIANTCFPSDTSQTLTTSDFLLYSGALTQTQITALDSAGAGASTSTISALGINIASTPEPGSMALMGLGGLAAFLFRRRSAGK